MPLAARSRIALLLASVATFACASPRTIAASEPTLAGPTRLEDGAETPYFGPNEVEAPALLLTPIEPAYPSAMRSRGQEGEVLVRVLVRADGSVAGARLVDTTDAAFTEAVSEHIRGARFAPALRAGRPVSSWVLVRIRFRLG